MGSEQGQSQFIDDHFSKLSNNQIWEASPQDLKQGYAARVKQLVDEGVINANTQKSMLGAIDDRLNNMVHWRKQRSSAWGTKGVTADTNNTLLNRMRAGTPVPRESRNNFDH